MTKLEDIDIDSFDTSDFTQEQTGYFPYFAPEVSCAECHKVLGEKEFRCQQHPSAEVKGNRFLGMVITKDIQGTGDDAFVRFVIQAKVQHTLHIGPKEDEKTQVVKGGEFFNVSEYATMPLARFFGMLVLVETKGKRKHPKDPKKTIWDFTISVDSKTKAILEGQRESLAQIAAKQQFDANVARLTLASAGKPVKADDKRAETEPAS